MDKKKQTLTVDEAARCLGIGRNSAYEAIARGEIPAVKIGKRLLVPKVVFEKWLSGGSQSCRLCAAHQRGSNQANGSGGHSK